MDRCFKKIYRTELVGYWKIIIREEIAKDDKKPKYKQYLLNEIMRKYVWNISGRLNDDKEGVPGNACQIAEHYYLCQIEIYHQLSAAQKQIFIKKFVDNFLLTLTCAIFIASKTVGTRTSRRPNAKEMCFLLKTFEYNATPKMIFAHEFELMKSLDFKLPLWSGVETALVIAMAVSMDPQLFMLVASAMDMAEYMVNNINEDIYSVTGLDFAICPARLAAGVVVSVAQMNSMHTDVVSQKVAYYCALPIQYVKFIKNIIIHHIY